MKLHHISRLAGTLLVLAILAAQSPAYAQTDPTTGTGYDQTTDRNDGPDVGWLGLLGLLGLLGMRKRPVVDNRAGRPAHAMQ